MITQKSFQAPFSFELYLPEGPGPFGLICITPILGRLVLFEDLFLERRFAAFFARHGLAAAVLDRPIFEFDFGKGLEQIEAYLESSLARNRKILDFLVLQKEIDTDRIGSFGISFGAVINTLWGAEDTRLKAHALALVGGNLPEIFIRSRDPLMRSYLKAALRTSGLVPQKLKDTLSDIFQKDPLQAAASLKKENVLMVLGLFDRVIPLRYGLALRQALGGPQTIFVPLGHYFSILAIPVLKYQTLAFFRKTLLKNSKEKILS